MSRARWSRALRTTDRRGATAVEMAIVAPIFILFVFSLVEFGRMTMVQQALTNAAREGCRHAALATTQSATAVDTRIRSHLNGVIPNPSSTSVCRVTLQPSSLSSVQSGDDITATVEVNYADVPWYPTMFLDTAVLRGTATMKRE